MIAALWRAFTGWLATWWRRIATVAVLAAWVASVGWAWETSAELAGGRVKAKWDEERLAAEQQFNRDLLRAGKAADAAQVQYLRERDKNAASIRKQTTAALAATTGLRCFGPDLVGVLNASPPDAGLPADPGGSAGGPGRPAADSGNSASDADLVRWIGEVSEQYAGCRAQIRAINILQGASP